MPTRRPIESLSFQSVAFSYDADPVFRALNFDLPMNANVFVTGSGGGGQSTFLKLLAVLLQPTGGSYMINGHDTTQMSFEEFLPWRLQIGYSFDYGGLFANRTLEDNLTLPLLYHKKMEEAEASEFAHRQAAHFGFERQLHHRPAAVSGGLRKLICVLRAFILDPRMIVLDDPFTGIGTDPSRKLVEYIRERRERASLQHVFLTSRDEVWPHWLGCRALYVNGDQVRFEEGKAAS